MPRLAPRPILLKPPLRERTLAERKYLLLSSAGALVVARGGLVPSKITFLGIEFSAAQATALMRIGAAVVVYFALTFAIYAFADWLVWRMEIQASRASQGLTYPEGVNPGGPEYDAYLLQQIPAAVGFSTYVAAVLLAVFEFALPLAAGAFALYSLLTYGG